MSNMLLNLTQLWDATSGISIESSPVVGVNNWERLIHLRVPHEEWPVSLFEPWLMGCSQYNAHEWKVSLWKGNLKQVRGEHEETAKIIEHLARVLPTREKGLPVRWFEMKARSSEVGEPLGLVGGHG